MIRFEDWYLPDGETHLQTWMNLMQQRRLGRLGYQLHKYEKALAFVPPDRRRVAVDVGAHVGLWSYFLAHDFGAVHAFEPKKEHRECWTINMLGLRGIAQLHECALGDDDETWISLHTSPASSGDTYVAPKVVHDPEEKIHGSIRMRTLDSFQLPAVDFLKIDCEGFELFVLMGAVETLKAFRPVVIVEQKPTHGEKYGLGDTDAVDFLTRLGYEQRDVVSGDYILTWGTP
jgi:FkbM family methyltransferase